MKKIELTQGKYALIDDKDFQEMSKIKWFYTVKGYAAASVYLGGGRANRKYKTIYMHREINQTPEGFETDHINGDRLDNRRTNLRRCTLKQNRQNKSTPSTNTTGYKGVTYDKTARKYRAQIRTMGKLHTLGRFKTPEEASVTYQEAAKKYFGKFARAV